jgi:hypothetical protein
MFPEPSQYLKHFPTFVRLYAGAGFDSGIVPRRQLTERQDAPASIASAAIDLLSGMCRRNGALMP